MAAVVVLAVVLTAAVAPHSLSAEEIALLVIGAPLVAYLGVRDVELPVRPRRHQPFSVLNWDARGVVVTPLVILTPYAAVALMVGVVSGIVMRTRPPRHSVLVDAYNGAAQCLATLATGAAAAAILTSGHTTSAYILAVAVGVLLNEIVTFVLIVGLWLTAERLADQGRDQPSSDRPSARELVRLSLLFIPVVISMASGIVLSYVDGAYVAAAVLTLVPILVIELLRHFGQTTIALQKRDEDRNGVLRLLLESAEQQRRSLAEELHDGPLQSVLACRLTMDDGDALYDERLAGWLDRAAGELRGVVRGLVPEVLSERGLEQAIRDDAEMLKGAFSEGIRVSFTVATSPSASTEFLLYRLVHEGLLNAARHSQADRVAAEVREQGDHYIVRVEDDGRGISAEEISSAWDEGHLGIAALRQRVGIVGGKFDVATRATGGTELMAQVPVSAGQEKPESAPAAAKIARWWAGLTSWTPADGAATSSAGVPGREPSPSERPTLDRGRQASRRSG